MSILKLKPACKDYLWGGHRLVDEYNVEYDGDILADRCKSIWTQWEWRRSARTAVDSASSLF